MINAKKYFRKILIVVAIITGVAGCMAQVSCTPAQMIPLAAIAPAPIPAATTPDEYQSPPEPTAYSITARHPFEAGVVIIKQGGSINLSVAIFSMAETPISIRLALSDNGSVPDYIRVESPSEFMPLNPGENTYTSVTIRTDKDTPPGRVYLSMKGELQEPFRECGGETLDLLLTVVESLPWKEREKCQQSRT